MLPEKFNNLMMGKLMVTMAMNVKDMTISTIGPPSLLLTMTVSIISSSSRSELCRIVMVFMRVESRQLLSNERHSTDCYRNRTCRSFYPPPPSYSSSQTLCTIIYNQENVEALTSYALSLLLLRATLGS